MTNTSPTSVLTAVQLPQTVSHKGQNGRLLIIGGSHLFHAASLWALIVASRIVDLVHYASVEENNELVRQVKKEFHSGIVVARKDIEEYIEEDDTILIGPGMVRADEGEIFNLKFLPAQAGEIRNVGDIEKIPDEGVQTYHLTNYLLRKHPHKKWVIDAGALQMMELALIPKNSIVTPHHGEFERLKKKMELHTREKLDHLPLAEQVQRFAQTYQCFVLHKGAVDIAASPDQRLEIPGGNAGMTKGGTGDVLAGLIAALLCSNDPWTAMVAGSVLNKQAGDDLFATMGYWFNASDLADQIPKTMKRLLGV